MESFLSIPYFLYVLGSSVSLIIIALFVIFQKQFNNSLSNNFVNFHKNKLSILTVLLPIFILSIPFFYVMLLLLWTLRKGIETILKIKYDSKFGGMLKGCDAYFAIDDVSKSVINFLMIIKFDGKPADFYNTVKKHIHQKVFLDVSSDSKLQSTRHICLGYYYTLKNEYDVHECVSLMDNKCDDEVINEKEFQKIMNDMGSRSLPKDNSVFWEVVVGNKPVKWKNTSIKQYPLIIRLHHSLADGVTLIRWFVTYLADHNYNHTIKEPKSQEKINTTTSLRARILNGLVHIFLFIILPGFVLLNLIRKKDKNILHGQNLSGEKMLLWKIEDNKKYINLIKEIKKKFPGTSFTEIVLMALVGTFSKYFEEQSFDVPENIYCLITAALKFPNFESCLTGPKKHISLTGINSFTCTAIFLPVSLQNEDTYKILNKLKRKMDVIKNSLLIQVNYLGVNISGILPKPLTEYLSNKTKGTLIFSNLPSNLDPITLFGGLALDDCIIWTINRGFCGISIMIFTYDEKIRLALNVDKALIPTEEKAKNIVDNFFKQLDRMNEEGQ